MRSKHFILLLPLSAHVRSKESVSADASSLPPFTHLQCLVSDPKKKLATGQATSVLHTLTYPYLTHVAKVPPDFDLCHRHIVLS